ncbi:MAG: hypothetical protein ACI8WB_001713 [Phenylobacterium sp.]|jgi:hypothetical protein
MAINSVAIQSFQSISQTRLTTSQSNHQGASQGVAQGASQGDNQPQTRVGKFGETENISAAEQRRTEQNISILQSSYSISLGNSDNAASLLFKSALEGINAELEPTLGKNAAQKAFDEGIDFSPEATAKRIVDFATSFFPLYQQQHKDDDKSLEDQLDSFLGVVGGGVEQGFGEAKDILSGLKVFNGEIEENANSTYDLIYEGFDKFKQSVLEANQPASEQATAEV